MSQSPENTNRSRLSLPPSADAGLSRRAFLQQLALVGALGASGGLVGCTSSSLPGLGDDAAKAGNAGGLDVAGASTGNEPVGKVLSGANAARVLVVVELTGGNDGLSTLVPAADGRYYDYRPTMAVAEDEVLSLDDEVGLHPALTGLHKRGIMTVEGVGPIDGDLSHFAMTDRWVRGDVNGKQPFRTGFLGRVIDALSDGSPMVGASVSGPTPRFVNQLAGALSLSDLGALWFLQQDWPEPSAYQRALSQFGMSGNDGSGRPGALANAVLQSYGQLGDLAGDLSGQDEGEIDWETPMLAQGGDLGRQLYLASELIAADVGVRVVYAKLGDFDTHQNHNGRQQQNLARLDAAVDGFLDRVADSGRGDDVLVATVSEFGRRLSENDGGLDHGSASTMLLAGPVKNQRAGERPSLEDLDEDDNLKVSIGFDRYQATLCEEWLGVEAASILTDDAKPLGLLA